MTSTGTRAIVLGGGGVAGIAWESALLSRLQSHGIDLAAADTVLGTSAGSVVGTALRAGGIAEWYEAQLAAPTTEYDAVGDLDVEPFVAAVAAAAESDESPDAARARLGELALQGNPARSEQDSIARIRALLPVADWPDGDLRVTVVDAEDGAFRVITASDEVELARAVAASCAVPGVYPTITIDGRRYMDGGMRSGTNADAAGDHDRILVVSCGPEVVSSPLGPSLPEVVATLGTSREVLVVEADEESRRAFGSNSLLLATRTASAESGRRQAEIVVDSVRAFWEA